MLLLRGRQLETEDAVGGCGQVAKLGITPQASSLTGLSMKQVLMSMMIPYLFVLLCGLILILDSSTVIPSVSDVGAIFFSHGTVPT